MSTAGGSDGNATGSSGGRRGGGSPFKRASRSVGPSSARPKRRGSLSTAFAASSSRSHSQQQHYPFGSNAASSPISFLGLASPTTPIEAASLQRSMELREEQRRIIDERRRLAASASNSNNDTSTNATSPSMSTDSAPQPASARSAESSSDDGGDGKGGDAPMAGSSSHGFSTAAVSPIPVRSASSIASPRIVDTFER